MNKLDREGKVPDGKSLEELLMVPDLEKAVLEQVTMLYNFKFFFESLRVWSLLHARVRM